MATLEDRRRTFDEVAGLFDQVRPGYPSELVAEIIVRTGIDEESQVLEIGCGSGHATLAFAKRGYSMTCLEPGVNLARIAAHNLSSFPNIRIEVCTFEEWPAVESSIDLILAAQSFHWVDPLLGPKKAANLLKADGAVAIFGNQPEPKDSGVFGVIKEAYRNHAPEVPPDWVIEDVDLGALFDRAVTREYPWRATYTSDEYVSLMETRSPIRLLVSERRAALLASIRNAVDEHGGSVTIDYVARLSLFTKAAGGPAFTGIRRETA